MSKLNVNENGVKIVLGFLEAKFDSNNELLAWEDDNGAYHDSGWHNSWDDSSWTDSHK